MTATRNTTMVTVLISLLWLSWGVLGPFSWDPFGVESGLLLFSWFVALYVFSNIFRDDLRREQQLQKSAASAKSWNTVALKYQKQVADLVSIQAAYETSLDQHAALVLEIEELREKLRGQTTRADALSSARRKQLEEYAHLQKQVKDLLSPLRVILKRSPVFMTKEEKKFITRATEEVSRRHRLAAVRDTFPGIPVPPAVKKKPR